MSIKAVIFDLDGTVTEPYFDFEAIRRQMGLEPDDGPVWEAIKKMSPQRRLDAEKILAYHEQNAVNNSTLNPGASRTLSSLRKAGISIGVLTRNRKSNALAVAAKHGLKFDIVVGREDGPVKPDSFGLLEICRQFGVKPHQTLMVGDYLYDMECANAAGAVAVLLANHDRADEFAEYADFTIETIDQILQIIENKK